MKMRTQTINKIKIEPLVKNQQDKRPYKYEDVFSHPFPVVYISAMRNSGKSVLLSNLIHLIADKKNTVIRLISSTVKNDSLFMGFITKIRKDGYHFEIYDNPNEIPKQLAKIETFLEDSETRKLYDKEKYQFPLVIYAVDDARVYLKSDFLSDLSTRSRHFKICYIVSSQRYKDIKPVMRANLTNLILFKGSSEQNLETIYDEIINSTETSYDEFRYMYEEATKDPYGFLYIDRDKQEFRKNMNELILRE